MKGDPPQRYPCVEVYPIFQKEFHVGEYISVRSILAAIPTPDFLGEVCLAGAPLWGGYSRLRVTSQWQAPPTRFPARVYVGD